jgi:hypothetical protein
VTSQYTIRGIDQDGKQVYATIALTPDRMIAVYNPQPGAILITPRAISHIVDHLRVLQAQALQGVTWR